MRGQGVRHAAPLAPHPKSRIDAADPRKAFVRRADFGTARERCAGLDQPDRRRADRPGRRLPRFAFIEAKPNGVADQNIPIAELDRLMRLQMSQGA